MVFQKKYAYICAKILDKRIKITGVYFSSDFKK